MKTLTKQLMSSVSGAGFLETWQKGIALKVEGDRLTHEYHRNNAPSISVSNDVKDVTKAFGIGCTTGVVSGQPFGITNPFQNCMVSGATAGTASVLYKMSESSKDKK